MGHVQSRGSATEFERSQGYPMFDSEVCRVLHSSLIVRSCIGGDVLF